MEPRGDELVFTLEHCLTEGKVTMNTFCYLDITGNNYKLKFSFY